MSGLKEVLLKFWLKNLYCKPNLTKLLKQISIDGLLGQGNHGQASSKMSNYLKDIQSFLNLEKDNMRHRNDNVKLRNQHDKRKETSPCDVYISTLGPV
ncbi:hypothetical protein BpHYR1_041758 [Brachionus plicatilis]|uniref:Uncharacterized protein n=1 Tax=Brachionus plicatilis TaxID=10195 RepID=A0A3M7RVI2_BRAPC|nr:hypothetical protein BpHYR1_041758 [Brachionus plicatilis]